MNWGSILQVASTLGGFAAITTLVSLPWVLRKMRSETRKNDADAAKVLTESAAAFLAPARAEIRELETSLKAAKVRVIELEAEVQQLRNQVSAMSKEIAELRDENTQLRGDSGGPTARR